MFDDNNPRNAAPPANLPIGDEPKDMFGDIDTQKKSSPNALEAGRLKKKDTGMNDSKDIFTPDGEEKNDMVKEPILGKVILIVLIGALLAGIGLGGFWIYSNFLANKNVVTVVDETKKEQIVQPTTTAEVQTPTLPEEIVTNTNEGALTDMKVDEVLFGEPIDSDRDGLDDLREKEIGTDPRKPDTDNDGLIDGDEVIIWKTNPLNPDTDGDGYLDGLEVKSGYNPLGSGKIFTSSESDTTTVTNTQK